MTKESSPMMMTHTGNASSLQCQEVGRRNGAKDLVVIWSYSVDLVWLVWFVSKCFVNEIIMIIIKHLKKLDYQRAWSSSPNLCLIIKCFDNQVQEPNNQINQYPKKSLISFLTPWWGCEDPLWRHLDQNRLRRVLGRGKVLIPADNEKDPTCVCVLTGEELREATSLTYSTKVI